MLLIYLVAGIIALAGGFFGHQPLFRLEKVNKSNLLNSILAASALFTVLMIAYISGYFPQAVAAPFMMFVYSFLTGFFIGYGWRLIELRSRAGEILYMYRSFWIDHAPGIAVMLVILFGIYRTSLLIEQPVTGLRLTSGLSLIAFGFFGWTLKIVPEFRTIGVMFLDRLITWKQIIAWRWQSEEVISIDYLHNPGRAEEQVREFRTAVPVDDRKKLETVLNSKMLEHEEERKKILGMGGEL